MCKAFEEMCEKDYIRLPTKLSFRVVSAPKNGGSDGNSNNDDE